MAAILYRPQRAQAGLDQVRETTDGHAVTLLKRWTKPLPLGNMVVLLQIVLLTSISHLHFVFFFLFDCI